MAWTPPDDVVALETVDEVFWNEQIPANMRELWHRIAYVEFTANVTLTAGTTEATPVDIVSAGAVTFTGSNLCVIKFYAPKGVWTTGAVGAGISLWEGATDLGNLAEWASAGGSGTMAPATGERYITPSSGSHTYKIRGWNDGGGTVYAGAGGVGVMVPGFVEIWQRG